MSAAYTRKNAVALLVKNHDLPKSKADELLLDLFADISKALKKSQSGSDQIRRYITASHAFVFLNDHARRRPCGTPGLTRTSSRGRRQPPRRTFGDPAADGAR